MAKTVTKLKVKRRPPPKAEKVLTLEEAREQFPLGTLERAIAELKALLGFKDIAREHKNAENRQKTQASKSFTALITEEILGVGDELQIGDTAFKYDYHVSESIDRRALYNLVASGKVKLDDFLNSISINKETASKLIGDHILLPITHSETGKKLDIRVRDLATPVAEPKIVRKPPPPPAKKKLQRDIDEKPADNVSNNAGTGALRRQRKVRNVGA